MHSCVQCVHGFVCCRQTQRLSTRISRLSDFRYVVHWVLTDGGLDCCEPLTAVTAACVLRKLLTQPVLNIPTMRSGLARQSNNGWAPVALRKLVCYKVCGSSERGE